MFRLVVKGTIEERRDQTAERKRYLDVMVNRDTLQLDEGISDGLLDLLDDEEEVVKERSKAGLLKHCLFGADKLVDAAIDDELNAGEIHTLVASAMEESLEEGPPEAGSVLKVRQKTLMRSRKCSIS